MTTIRAVEQAQDRIAQEGLPGSRHHRIESPRLQGERNKLRPARSRCVAGTTFGLRLLANGRTGWLAVDGARVHLR